MYEQSHDLTKKYGTSYFYAALLLTKPERNHIFALYSLCRYADDLVDVLDGKPGTSTSAKKNLAKFEEEVNQAIDDRYVGEDLLGAIAKTWNELNLDRQLLDKFFLSMRLDLSVSSYETLEDLMKYTDGSAAVIGEMVLPVIAPDIDHETIRQSARDLGDAFQLTNFIRDIGEDQVRGRTYLPLKDFAEFGIDPNAIEENQAFSDFLKNEINLNKEFYKSAYVGVTKLKGRRGACVRTAYRLYGGILEEVLRADYKILNKRVRVPKWRKIAIMIRELVRVKASSLPKDYFINRSLKKNSD